MKHPGRIFATMGGALDRLGNVPAIVLVGMVFDDGCALSSGVPEKWQTASGAEHGTDLAAQAAGIFALELHADAALRTGQDRNTAVTARETHVRFRDVCARLVD